MILYGGIAYQGSDRRSCNVQGTNYLSAAEKGYDQYYISFSVRGISSDPQPHIFKLICENDGRVMMESREPETISSGSTSTINCTVDLEKIPGDYTLYIDDVPAYRFSTAVE